MAYNVDRMSTNVTVLVQNGCHEKILFSFRFLWRWAKNSSSWACKMFKCIYIYIYIIQDVPGGIVNNLGGGSMEYSK